MQRIQSGKKKQNRVHETCHWADNQLLMVLWVAVLPTMLSAALLFQTWDHITHTGLQWAL